MERTLAGLRQVGKTILSKMLYRSFDYLDHDHPDDRLALIEKKLFWAGQRSAVLLTGYPH